MQQTIDTREIINVYYGTTSGNSSRLAFQFADEATQHKFIPKVFNLKEFNPDVFIQTRLNIFFVSTYGVGGPTSDAIDFHNWLQSKDRKQNELQGVHFTVFALGNTKHEHFCGMGLKTDARLEELGATRIFQLGKGNSCDETTDNDYSVWVESGLFAALEALSPLVTVPANQVQSSIYKIKEFNNIDVVVGETLSFQAQKYKDSHSLKIIEIKELRKAPSPGNSTLYLSLESQNIPYKAAQNIGIYPENSEEYIQEICTMLNLDPQYIFQIETKGNHPFPTPISVHNYLKKYCDFLGPITKKQLYTLSQLVDDQKAKEELKFVSSHKGREEYDTNYLQTRQCFFHLVKKYNIRNISLQQLIELCPLISPRYFTIASSPLKNPNKIEIIASELLINKERLGLCSQFLRNVKAGQEIKCFLQDSAFLLPQNPQAPILLLGIGAGLAPMRAFIQEKDEFIEQNKLDQSPFKGPMTLFFGCRTMNDYLFKEELEEYEKNGTLNQLKVAFSREGQQIRITNYLDVEFLNQFLESGGVIYVCGSTQMGRDVQIAIENMFKQARKVMPYLAYRKVNELEEQKIFVKELWG
ncbi:unnamed protein product [Paramecium octaurelia]|uniref:Uncharacterized protein n=1 Tax=Paramecium octaurelia TaxID=43137 RepID=A0A8S1YGZ5_PAROT|nr:unnamed protein product [Paramecium octaurelia]